MEARPPSNFFISYTSTDSEWARWIVQTLEANGYRTESMAVDFLPGQNFVARMHQIAMAGVRVLAVISPAHMESPFGMPEWAAAFADDPTGERRQLIPVLVATVARRGLLNQIIPIDLVGKSEVAAVEVLLKGVGSAERHLPEMTVPFPGAARTEEPEAESVSVPGEQEWAALDKPIALPAAQPDQQAGSWESSVVLELHLVPVPFERIQISAMRDLPDELAAAARSARFFSGSQALTAEVRDGVAYVQSHADREVKTRGLSMTREGTLSLWEGLPQDGMGAVVDVADVQTRIIELIQVATELARIRSSRVAVGARLVTRGLYIFGDASTVGSRSSAGGLKLGDGTFEVLPEDTVSIDLIQREPESVGREMAARLEAAWSEAKDRFV